jgi:segregation and condensation protein B
LLYLLKKLTLEYISQHIEALIFAADQPISTEDIQGCLEEVFGLALSEEEVLGRVEEISNRFELIQSGNCFQFLTKPAFHDTLNVFLRNKTRKKLSKASLETLSIIAYKQPVSKLELERIRGVNCDYAVQKLLEKELILISGRSDGPGRPLLYATGEKFLHYFGINSLKDLPMPKEFKEHEFTAGEESEFTEN